MEKVAVKRCKNYNEKILMEKMRDLFDQLGGLDSYIKTGQKVLLKVNLLLDKPPEAAVTTNPVFVKAIVKLVQETGAGVIIGDSPGGPFTVKSLKKTYQVAGLARIAEETGAELNFNTARERVAFLEGEYNKSFVLGHYITDADLVINLPKLKTHGMTMYTGAVKNLFGAIPGLLKAEYHLKMPRIDLFSRMLVELADCVRPVLNIMDGITGMEGEGPSGGRPRDFGYIMASSSALALDIASVYLLGIEPLTEAPVIEAAGEMGLPDSLEQIRLVGDELIPAVDVDIPVIEKASNLIDRRLPQLVSNLLDWLLRPRPVFDHQACVGCGDCYQNCPADTIQMVDRRPEVDLNNCIRCFCCQELCKYQAVSIKRPLLGKILFG